MKKKVWFKRKRN